MDERKLQKWLVLGILTIALWATLMVVVGSPPAFHFPGTRSVAPTLQPIAAPPFVAVSCVPGPYGCGTEYGKGPVDPSAKGGR